MTWHIIHTDGTTLVTAPTELEAWIRAARLEGVGFNWDFLRQFVTQARWHGFRAEVRAA